MSEDRKRKILEEVQAKSNVVLYKKMVSILADYCQDTPATGCDRVLNSVIEKGVSVIPSDLKAREILTSVLNPPSDSVPLVVQELLNIKFPSLPRDLKPRYNNKEAKKVEVAFWCTNGVISDKVFSLLLIKGKKGFWCDVNGNRVTIKN